MENKKRNPWIAIIPAMVTIMLKSVFLWGQLIDFPRGTPEGGRIAAIGVCGIIISVSAITYFIIKLRRKKNNNICFKNK
jgi:hypothetical protein